jgi:hypothetical protein
MPCAEPFFSGCLGQFREASQNRSLPALFVRKSNRGEKTLTAVVRPPFAQTFDPAPGVAHRRMVWYKPARRLSSNTRSSRHLVSCLC